MGEIRCPLEVAAVVHGNRPAIVAKGDVVSYREYERRVAGAVGRLRAAGCHAGERIAVLLPNAVEYLILLLAVMRLGAVACPLNTRVPRRSLRKLLDKIVCRKLVLDASVRVPDEWEGLTLLDVEELTRPDGSGRAQPAAAVTVSLDQLATILCTSGSTGTPKAVLHSYGNHYYSAKGSNFNIPLQPGDRWLLNLPLYHVGGLGIVFRCLMAGAAAVLPSGDEELGAVLQGEAVTHASLVATQLQRLLQQQPPRAQPYRALRAVILGGGPIPIELVKEARAREVPVYASYGSTEMASQITTTGPTANDEQLQTSGKILPYRNLMISRDGEIWVKGETLFKGYVHGERVVRPLNADGWFATGDLGSVDGDGYLRVLGRRDHMFFSGGENVHPEPIEEALCRIRGVKRALVVPVPDEEFGQLPVAFVQSRGGPVEAVFLAEQLSQTLPRYMIPRAFYEWPAGAAPEELKVDRAYFRELAMERMGS